MKLTGVLILIGLINCASKSSERSADICTEKYVSKKWKVTVHHSKEWSPYEFHGNNIGLEYQGLQNFERRYEAEVVISFIKDTLKLKEEEFYTMFISSLENKKKQIAKSMGAEIKTNLTDKGQVEFANKKWKIFDMKLSASLKADKIDISVTNYLWYSSDLKIKIAVSVKGKEIDGLLPETDCILNGLIFN